MQMDTGEICRSYAAAKDKNGQIKVLADLNACSTKEVLNVLTDGGMISGMPPKQQAPIQKAMSDKQAGKPGGKRATPVKWTVDMDKELIKLCEEGMKPQDIAERMGLDVAQVKRWKGRLTAAGYIFPRLKGKCADTSNAMTENYRNGGAEELPPPRIRQKLRVVSIHWLCCVIVCRRIRKCFRRQYGLQMSRINAGRWN